ncbi:hypothetical protein ETU10_01940 [Apibacter muscae]|uniref:hypothetical protein n=1 Tax=Apibacter muscae TaxID=2509004 RepID=UPI0011ABB788|nr:hypothetical protein [Apibacter muscae]TWP24744.1 hypothetical protein ETU10_01940 [Apibacter muscae]
MKLYLFPLLCLIVLSNGLHAQQTSTSPYSSIGLGDEKFSTDITVSSMGGIGTSYISDFNNEANFNNPAANRNLKYTSFNVSVNTDFINEKTSSQSSDRSTTYLSNISVAFPAGEKSRIGFNLRPYSTLGYNMDLSNNSNGITQNSSLKGRGGLNMFGGFYSYNITQDLSVAAKINYIWGQLKKEEETSIQGANLKSGTFNRKDYGYFDYTLALAYRKKFTNDHLIKLGATYTFGRDVNTDVNSLYSTYYYNSLNEKQSIDTLSYSRGTYDSKIPFSYSLGVAYGKEFKWSLGLDFKYINQSKLEIPQENYTYNNRYRVALGGWFLPNINGFKSYFEKIIYRYGIYYEETGIELNNQSINQYGITAGLSLPIGKTGKQDPSTLNLGLELGQRGTTSEGLIKENFVNFRIGFNFDDLWFRKRQFD